MSTLIDQLRTFITDTFLYGLPTGTLSNNASFFENGIIDSTGLLELIAFVERSYNIRLADDELVPDNLDSLERLATLIQRKQSVMLQEAS